MKHDFGIMFSKLFVLGPAEKLCCEFTAVRRDA
jgi:hypothetical protein